MKRQKPQTVKPFISGGVYNPDHGSNESLPLKRNYSYQSSGRKPPHGADELHDERDDEPLMKIKNEFPLDGGSAAANEDPDDSTSENGKDKKKVMFKKIVLTRKKSSVRAKEKKVRQNRQLRKVLQPKNALMALHEVKGANIGDFVISSNPTGGYTVVVMVNDKEYRAKGSSKMVAKNNACEKALRDIVVDRLRRNPRRVVSRADASPGNSQGNASNDEELLLEENDDEQSEKMTEERVDNDVPMINLASFALFKLFSEWESLGFNIPEFHTMGGPTSPDNGQVKEPKAPPIRTELPTNWESMHPATLLCMMRPGLTYIDLGVEGEKPNCVQSIGVNVDDRKFVGKGRSKKIARRNAAAMVCNAIFNANFPIDNPNQNSIH